METWVAYHRGTPADMPSCAREDATVEITCFGLLPWAIGKGVGGHLLEFTTARAWDLAERQPDREPTRRVWLHTCSLDSPVALANYQARGFRIYDSRLNVPGDEYEGDAPGPWPGAGPGRLRPPVPRPIAGAGRSARRRP